MLPQLDEFIEQCIEGEKRGTILGRNSFIDHPEWSSLYIRVSRRIVDRIHVRTIDLANIEARERGRGACRRLLVHLRRKYPDRTIFVESVLDARFQDFFRAAGFQATHSSSGSIAPSFYLLPETELRL